jgi:hypothetical protein
VAALTPPAEIPANLRKISRSLQGTCFGVLLFLVAVIPAVSQAQIQPQTKPAGSEPTPEAAVPAILAAFDKYEVVGIPEGHGMKDMDDFILSLIRDPAFSGKVNDIAVECGNSLYQPTLDRYIAGEDVPFTEVRKVWRNTTQPMCGMSGFFEQFFPLVRAINQKLSPERRLRVLAGDPPIDWDQVKSSQDIGKFSDRDASIASVMEKEVLSKNRKALMLFGNFHLMHGAGVGAGNAVTIYEKDYPNRTFIISDLGDFDTGLPALSSSSFATWPVPSLARAKGTWLGAFGLDHFYPPTVWTDDDCNVHEELPKNEQKPMADLVDAFLYLGPQDLRLAEPMPADIALDIDYMTELLRRETLAGMPGARTLKDFDQSIVTGAGNPVLVVPKLPDLKPYLPMIKQSCLDRKSGSSAPQ